MTTIKEVEQILSGKSLDLTAKRWVKSECIMKSILESHISWNKDHINHPDMICSLENNIDYYLDNPSLIEEEREPAE